MSRKRRASPPPDPDPDRPIVIELTEADLRGRRVFAEGLCLATDNRGLLRLGADTIVLIEPKFIDMEVQPDFNYMHAGTWARLRRHHLRKARP